MKPLRPGDRLPSVVPSSPDELHSADTPLSINDARLPEEALSPDARPWPGYPPLPDDTKPVPMRCIDCGYVLDHLTSTRCPECGREFNPHDAATYAWRTDSPWACVALACGGTLVVAGFWFLLLAGAEAAAGVMLLFALVCASVLLLVRIRAREVSGAAGYLTRQRRAFAIAGGFATLSLVLFCVLPFALMLFAILVVILTFPPD